MAKRPAVIIEVRASNVLLVTAVHVKMKLGDNTLACVAGGIVWVRD